MTYVYELYRKAKCVINTSKFGGISFREFNKFATFVKINVNVSGCAVFNILRPIIFLR